MRSDVSVWRAVREFREGVVGRGILSLRELRRGRSCAVTSGVGGMERGEKSGWERDWRRRV